MQSNEANLSDYNPLYTNKPNRFQVRMNSIIADMPELTKHYFSADISNIFLKEKSSDERLVSNIKALFERQADKIKGSTAEKPKIITASTDGKYTKNGANSVTPHNVIIIEEPLLKRKFEEKAWTKPSVAGVKPLPVDQFSNLKQYIEFTKQHEIAHLSNLDKWKNLSLAQRENEANNIALKYKNLVLK